MSALSESVDATAALNIDAMLSSYGGGSDIADATARVEKLALGMTAESHQQQAETASTRATTALVIESAGVSTREDVLQSPDKEGGLQTNAITKNDDKPTLAPSGISMPDMVVNLMKSLSTPANDGLRESIQAEDPNWEANHHLTWDQLTDVREIGKGLTCTVFTARIPGRKSRVITKVARARDKGRLEDQAERQLEAEFNVLRQVKHPHIVELLGAGFTPDGRRFLLLERLSEGTLGTFHALSSREQMKVPRVVLEMEDAVCRFNMQVLDNRVTECDVHIRIAVMLKQGFRRLTTDFNTTLTMVLHVAEALEYLQTEAIPGAVVLHRDIRPDNVGITNEGTVKIFDFGLSKALMKGHDGKLLCPMVGEAGSLRYAAPEVSLGLPHGGKADVYSWALLAWSVVAVRTPFEGIGRSAFYDRVVIGGERPLIDLEWPKAFQELLRDSWNGDPSMRPPIGEVVTRMKDLLKR